MTLAEPVIPTEPEARVLNWMLGWAPLPQKKPDEKELRKRLKADAKAAAKRTTKQTEAEIEETMLAMNGLEVVSE